MKNNEKKVNNKKLDESSSSKTIKTKKELTKQENMVPKKKNSNNKSNNKNNNKVDNSNKNQKQIKNNYKKNERVKKSCNLEDNYIKNDNKLKRNYHENNNFKTKKQDKVTNKPKNTKKKIVLILLIVIFLVFISLTTYNILTFIKYKSIVINNTPKTSKINYLDYYSTSIVTLNKKALYKRENEEFVKSGVVNSNIYLSLEEDEFSKDGYFRIKNTSYYIDYKNIKKEELKEEKTTYLNYVPFNESVKVTNPKFYLDEKIVFSILGEYKYQVLVKEKSYYGVLVNNKLYYLKKDDCSFYKNKNTNLKATNGVPVLVYHYTYDSSNTYEKKECKSIICLSDKKFDSHMKFIKDNNFYTATLNDLEMFIDGKIRLPEHTVVITIDDGYYTPKSIEILEKYDLHATLFLIGSVAKITGFDYNSKNLEVHSHTYDLHYVGACPGGQGSPIKCLAKDKILADLKKSRESLNNTPYFCYPFFEYNDYAISLLKEAGFRMAFAGRRMKVRVGANKYKLPRYGIINTTTTDDLKNILY